MYSSADEKKYERKWWVMMATGVAVFTATLNMSIINISLPAIQTALHTDVATVEWVVLIYSVILAVLLVTTGRLSDIVGRKTLYISGTIIFSIGALLCGLSNNIVTLIAARAVQAIGGASLVANSVAIVTDAFPKGELGKALGIIGSTVAIGTTVGPTLGGLILEYSSWSMIFFASVPMGLLAAALSAISLREEKVGQKRRFDYLGSITLAVFLFSGLMGITNGQENGWNSPLIGVLFLVSIIFGGLFIRVELRTSQPLLDLRLFRNRMISIPLLSCFLYFLAISANTFLMPFLLLQVFGYSTQTTGLLLISVPLALGLVAPFSGWLSDRIGSRILASLGLAVGGIALFLLSQLSLDSAIETIVPRLALLGLAGGLFQSPNNSSLMSAVPTDQRGVAAGLLATSRHLGLMFGIALAGAVWVTRRTFYTGVNGNLTQNVPEMAVLLGIKDALLVAGVICILAVVLSWMRGDRTTGSKETKNTAESQPETANI